MATKLTTGLNAWFLRILSTSKTLLGFYRSLRLTDDKLVTPKLPLQSQLTALHTVKATTTVSQIHYSLVTAPTIQEYFTSK